MCEWQKGLCMWYFHDARWESSWTKVHCQNIITLHLMVGVKIDEKKKIPLSLMVAHPLPS
jgi:hypothetical protein